MVTLDTHNTTTTVEEINGYTVTTHPENPHPKAKRVVGVDGMEVTIFSSVKDALDRGWKRDELATVEEFEEMLTERGCYSVQDEVITPSTYYGSEIPDGISVEGNTLTYDAGIKGNLEFKLAVNVASPYNRIFYNVNGKTINVSDVRSEGACESLQALSEKLYHEHHANRIPEDSKIVGDELIIKNKHRVCTYKIIPRDGVRFDALGNSYKVDIKNKTIEAVGIDAILSGSVDVSVEYRGGVTYFVIDNTDSILRNIEDSVSLIKSYKSIWSTVLDYILY